VTDRVCYNSRVQQIINLLFFAAVLLAGPAPGSTFRVVGRSGRFACEMTVIERTSDYTAWRVVYPSPTPPSFKEGRNVVAFYYEPVAARRIKGPAVMCMHILSGDGSLTKAIAGHFAACGLPALMPQMPLFLDRMPGEDPEAVLQGEKGPLYLAESFLAGPGDMLRSADFLASRPGVDPNRLRVMGTSLGGILSVTAAARDARFEKAAFLLAGGDLKGLFATSARPEITPIARAIDRADARTREKIELAWHLLEPTNHAARLAGRVRAGNVRMFNVAEDEVIPPAHTRTLASALGIPRGPNYEVRPALGHYTAVAALPDLADDLAGWFGGRVPPSAATPEREAIRRTFRALRRLVEWTPGGTGDDLRVDVDATVRDRSAVVFRRRLVLGGLAGGVVGCIALLVPDAAQPIAVARALIARLAEKGSLGVLSRLLPLRVETDPSGMRRIVARHAFLRLSLPLVPGRDLPAGLNVRLGRWTADIVFTERPVDNRRR